MQILTKKTKILAMFFLLLFLQIGFVVLQGEESNGIIDIGEIFGLEEGKIFGSGIEYSQLEGDINRITFTGEDADFKIGESSFTNIVPSGEENKAYIDLDLTGNIVEAEFMTNDNGGEYEINGASFITEANSLVSYNSKEKGKLYLEESEIKEIGKAISIRGKNIILPEGNLLEEGYLNFDELGNAFLTSADESTINGINLNRLNKNNEEDIKIFFGEGASEEKYILFGEDKFVVSGSENEASPLIEFTKSNSYLSVGEEDYLAFRTGRDGKIEINQENGINVLDYAGDFILNNGDNSIFSKDGNVYFRPNSNVFSQTSDTGSIPLEINSMGGKILMDGKGDILFEGTIEEVEIKGDKVKTKEKVYKSQEKYAEALEEYNEKVEGYNKEFENYEIEKEDYEEITEKHEFELEKLNSYKSHEDAYICYRDQDFYKNNLIFLTKQYADENGEMPEEILFSKEMIEITQEQKEKYYDIETREQLWGGLNYHLEREENKSGTYLNLFDYFIEGHDEDIYEEYGQYPEKLIYFEDGYSENGWLSQVARTVKDKGTGAYYTFEFAEPEEPFLKIEVPKLDLYEDLYFHSSTPEKLEGSSVIGWFDKSEIRDSSGLSNLKNKFPITAGEFMSWPDELKEKYLPNSWEALNEYLLKYGGYSRIIYNR